MQNRIDECCGAWRARLPPALVTNRPKQLRREKEHYERSDRLSRGLPAGSREDSAPLLDGNRENKSPDDGAQDNAHGECERVSEAWVVRHALLTTDNREPEAQVPGTGQGERQAEQITTPPRHPAYII